MIPSRPGRRRTTTSAPAPFAFVDGALDRADHLRDDTDALAALWPQARIVVLDDDGRALADADDACSHPTGARSAAGPAPRSSSACAMAQAWFAQSAQPSASTPRSASTCAPPPRTGRPSTPPCSRKRARCCIGMRAIGFCGACGGELEFVRAGWLGRARAAAANITRAPTRRSSPRSPTAQRLLLGRQSMAAAALVGARRFRRTGRIARTDRRPRSARGNRRARALAPLRRLAAVAVSRFADARFPRRSRPRRPRGGRGAGRRALVRRRHASAPDWRATGPSAPRKRKAGIALSAPISIARWLIDSARGWHPSRR